jgi:hypothetical protein
MAVDGRIQMLPPGLPVVRVSWAEQPGRPVDPSKMHRREFVRLNSALLGLTSASLVALLVTVVLTQSISSRANKSVELTEALPMKRFWKSFWTPLTLKQGSLENSNAVEKDLSEYGKDPLGRFFGLQHFPGTSLDHRDRMTQLHQTLEHRNPLKSFFGLQPFPGTSLKVTLPGRTMELHEIRNRKKAALKTDAAQSKADHASFSEWNRLKSAIQYPPRKMMMYQVCG